MQRRLFLQLPFVATSFAFVLPPLAEAHDASRKIPKKGVLVRAGQDRINQPFKFLDATFTVKVSGKDTDGRCVIFDTLRHEKVGPLLHAHTDCDEWFFVMDGEFKFQVGDDILRLKAGDSLLAPLGVPHAFVKTSEGTARLVIMHQPAGTMEEHFRTASQEPDQSLEARRARAEKHGIRYVGPPLKPD
ncbi:cupin 2 conserved barrel domain protein [Fibrisoma limi BUZ 3]|uniref:Cupin 2 conserved barrel domain protein n=1 Tax=Fibrisoma limi BUZ 3 TaxID=1185876 RepID=I2GRE8_9BACT|nr:cupin domain-containing protein [Fibrisoma limi]CCH56476.1 cupin 2 conserved barrel domain protein [Fibrisoma limi BUZ 3]